MKKNMLLWAWLMAAGMPVLAQNAYLENLKLENRTVEKADGKVRVQADICLDGVDLKRQQSLRLVPVLVSADGTQEALLPAVVGEGRVRGSGPKKRGQPVCAVRRGSPRHCTTRRRCPSAAGW